jgi:Peroxiredoxin
MTKAKYHRMLSGFRYLQIILLLSLLLTGCKDPGSFVINGEIKGLTHSDLYIVTQNNSSYTIDTIATQKGKFSYEGISENLSPVIIYMETGSAWVTVWAKNGEKISVKGDANYPELILAKGNKVSDLLSEFKESNKTVIQERCDLRDKERQNQDLNEELDMTDISTSFQIKNLDLLLKNKAEDFVGAHPGSFASLVLIQDYILDVEDAKSIQSYLEALEGEARENELYQKIKDLISREMIIAEGNPAPEFNLVTTANDSISLDTYKDKYLLLTFLASWCEACEQAYASLSDIRKEFSEKDLKILTISLDENSVDWKKLAEEKNIIWDQVIDNKGWDSDVADAYKVNAIPTGFLIDKKGTIIGSGLPLDIVKERLNLLIKGE